jgi:hypothetical protein
MSDKEYGLLENDMGRDDGEMDAESDHQANIISHARLVTMGDPNIANELEILE